MWNALILFVFVEAAGAEGTAIRCEFPGEGVAQKAIRVVLEPRPSLKDQPGRYRVMMEMNGRLSLQALAKPIDSTEERDVMIRGKKGAESTITVGLRDDGTAAFNVQTLGTDDIKVNRLTRLGACQGFETHIRRWLPS